MGYVAVDPINFNFFLDHFLSQLFVLLYVVLLLLQLLPQELHSVLHHPHLGVYLLQLVLLVNY